MGENVQLTCFAVDLQLKWAELFPESSMACCNPLRRLLLTALASCKFCEKNSGCCCCFLKITEILQVESFECLNRVERRVWIFSLNVEIVLRLKKTFSDDFHQQTGIGNAKTKNNEISCIVKKSASYSLCLFAFLGLGFYFAIYRNVVDVFALKLRKTRAN